MRRTAKFVIGAAGSAALLTATASAADRQTSKITKAQAPAQTVSVMLPDGTVERIVYHGRTAPQMVVAQTSSATPVNVVPVGMASADFEQPFAMMNRMSALLDQQMAAMFGHMRMLQAQARQGADASDTDVRTIASTQQGATTPSATSFHYSYVSSSTSSGGCTQSVSYTSDAAQAQPRVVRTSTGSCGEDNRPAASGLIGTPAIDDDRPVLHNVRLPLGDRSATKIQAQRPTI